MVTGGWQISDRANPVRNGYRGGRLQDKIHNKNYIYVKNRIYSSRNWFVINKTGKIKEFLTKFIEINKRDTRILSITLAGKDPVI